MSCQEYAQNKFSKLHTASFGNFGVDRRNQQTNNAASPRLQMNSCRSNRDECIEILCVVSGKRTVHLNIFFSFLSQER